MLSTDPDSLSTKLVKLDSSGKQVWNQSYNFNPKQDIQYSGDCADAIYQTKDGGFVLTGQIENFKTSKYKIFVIKTDKDGNVK